ncbi:MAG: hypothetical protein KF712_01010 [Akkermansiaceae bacterium]|nr:hypothetical protein [Akkermansiaceae bacterium]
MKHALSKPWIVAGISAVILTCGVLIWTDFPKKAAPSTTSHPQRQSPPGASSGRLPAAGRSAPKKPVDPAHPLTAAEYKKLHQEALSVDAEANPRIRRLLELNGRHASETARLQPTIKAITTWVNEATEPAEKQKRTKVFHDVLALTAMISTTYQWQEDELRSLMEPDETPAVRIFSKGLVNQEIDPSALMGSTPQARAAVDDIHLKLYVRLSRVVAESGAPAEHFNALTYDRMINSALAASFYGKAMQLSSPGTQELAQAEYQMRVSGERMVRDCLDRSNAAKNPATMASAMLSP